MEDNQHFQRLVDQLKNKDGSINEDTCKRITHQLINEKQISSIRESVRKKYTDLVRNTSISGCAKTWENQVSLSENALINACYEIEADLRILMLRRKNLIGDDEKTGISLISRGKISGVTTYRLSRAHIIHLNSTCIECNQKKINEKKLHCPISTLNTELAIICGLYFINKNYSDIHKDVRNEIIYTLNNRHTNQETLGIIFDTLKLESKKNDHNP